PGKGVAENRHSQERGGDFPRSRLCSERLAKPGRHAPDSTQTTLPAERTAKLPGPPGRTVKLWKGRVSSGLPKAPQVASLHPHVEGKPRLAERDRQHHRRPRLPSIRGRHHTPKNADGKSPARSWSAADLAPVFHCFRNGQLEDVEGVGVVAGHHDRMDEP